MNVTSKTYHITICDNGSYCCGIGTYADNCCKLKQGLFLVNGSATQDNPISLQDPLTSSMFSSITSLTLSTSISISASMKSSSEISSSSTSSLSFSPQKAAPEIGVIAGAAIGGAGGVVALILCALVWKGYRRMKSNHRNEMLQLPAISSSSTPSGRRNRGSELQFSQPYGHNGSGEMDGAGLTLELDPSTTWHEVE